MNQELHNHPQDGIFRGIGSAEPCKRCIMAHAAPDLLEALETLTIYAEAIAARVEYYNMSELTNIYAASMPELKQAIERARKINAKARGRA
jgi:hypothetical protein